MREKGFCDIKVWDYTGIPKAAPRQPLGEQPVCLEVDAWCVGGEDGILAYFCHDGKFCIAHGDDGHWQLMYACDEGWKEEIQEAVSRV